MPRPREFDEQDVVARAADLFWRNGYHATSVRDLGSELGLRSSSLYRTFTDKHSLFLRALDHYRATESRLVDDRLRAPGPGLDVLRETLIWMAGGTGHDDGRGCLVVNTVTELGAADPDVGQRTAAAFAGTRDTLAVLLRQAVGAGELADDLDVDGAAEMLFTIVLGLRVRERAGHDPRRMAAAIGSALDGLRTDAEATGATAQDASACPEG